MSNFIENRDKKSSPTKESLFYIYLYRTTIHIPLNNPRSN